MTVPIGPTRPAARRRTVSRRNGLDGLKDPMDPMDQQSSLHGPPVEGFQLERSSRAGTWPRVASMQCFGAGVPSESRKGLGWLAMLAIPVASCVGPLLVVALSAAGAGAWGGLGAGVAVATAVTLLVVMRRRRAAAYGTRRCEPPAGGPAARSTGGLGA